MKQSTDSERGSALLIVMALLVMLTMAAIVAVDTAHNNIELSFNQLHSNQAFYVAEVGLTRAFVELNHDNNWSAEYLNVPFEGGAFSVAVVDSSVDSDLSDTVLLRSAGTVYECHTNIEAMVLPDYRRPFEYGLFGDDSLTMDNNTCTDSYHSDSGSYDATRRDLEGDIGSNGYMTMTNSSLVGGDASSAIEDGIALENIADVLGDTTTGIARNELDVVSDAQYQWAEINSDAPNGFGGFGYTYNHGDKSLSIGQNSQVVLSGGTYYFSDISVESSSTLEIAAGSNVTIYMSGNLKLSQHSAVNSGGKPSSLQIYSQGDDLTIGENTEFRGAFYGPQADITIDNNTDIYGSVVGRSIKLRNHSCFHYDRSLRDLVTGRTGMMKMIAWKEY